MFMETLWIFNHHQILDTKTDYVDPNWTVIVTNVRCVFSHIFREQSCCNPYLQKIIPSCFTIVMKNVKQFTLHHEVADICARITLVVNDSFECESVLSIL